MPRGRDGHDRVEGQHPRDRPRREDPALEEGHFPYVLDGDLDTVGPTTSAACSPARSPPTPRSARSPVSCSRSATRRCRRTSATCGSRRTASSCRPRSITVGGPTMMHDFNVTRNHVIFMDLPAVLRPRRRDARRDADPLGRQLPGAPRRDARNGSDADVRWYDIDPCYVFHPMNAYEDGDTIVLDVSPQPHLARDSTMDFPRSRSSGVGRSTPTPARCARSRSTTGRRVPTRRRPARRPGRPLRLHDGDGRGRRLR